MAPAQQCLGAHHLVGAQIHDGLEQELQFALVHRDVQIRLQADQTGRLSRHGGFINHDLRRVLALGDRQRDVGLAHHILRALLARVHHRDARGRGHHQPVAAQLEGQPQIRLQNPRHAHRRLGGFDVEQQHGELIAAPARQHPLE